MDVDAYAISRVRCAPAAYAFAALAALLPCHVLMPLRIAATPVYGRDAITIFVFHYRCRHYVMFTALPPPCHA